KNLLHVDGTQLKNGNECTSADITNEAPISLSAAVCFLGPLPLPHTHATQRPNIPPRHLLHFPTLALRAQPGPTRIHAGGRPAEAAPPSRTMGTRFAEAAPHDRTEVRGPSAGAFRVRNRRRLCVRACFRSWAERSESEFAGDEHELDLGGAFPDLEDLRVAVV